MTGIVNNVTSSNPVLIIQPGKIQVQGDIDLTGSINTSNIMSTTVLQTTLKVNDKRIVIAKGDDNFANIDSATTNSSAGMIINGFPNGASDWIYEEANKSLLWNYNVNGLPDLGTNQGIDTESFWELQGGSFRMTYKKNYGTSNVPNVKDVTFGFRINEFEELELVKRFYYASSNAYVMKRVARFGRFY